jgi:alanine racemase
MTRPIRARFDANALRHNFAVARRYAGAAHIWSVIKAQAYGHGLLRVVQALDGLSDGFALIEIENAVLLRESGYRQPILMLEGFYGVEDLALFAEYDLTPVLHSPTQVDLFCRAALPVRLPIYLKLNTGMSRLGLNAAEFFPALAKLLAARSGPITLMTHFADADGNGGIGEQLACFEAIRGGRRFAVCMANSAALLRFPEAHGDWVRPGIMLYGSSPFPERQSADDLELRPVMTLESELIAVRTINAGECVGYGRAFVASDSMRVGVVACGYADGYPRHAPTGTPVLVAGQRTHTIGRVSMDKLCVDLSGIDAASVGSEVTLWGQGLSADAVAAAAGTVSYELFCALAQRVPIVATA